MSLRTKRIGRRMNAAEIAFDLAAKRVKAREASGLARAAERAADPGIGVDKTLPANQDVVVTTTTRGGKAAAERWDAFAALKAGMASGGFDAARKLEHDMRLRSGEAGRASSVVAVDCAKRKDAVQVQIEAGDRVKAALEAVGPRDAWLLQWLIDPPAEVALRFQTWREVVEYITGEHEAHGQGAAVRSACSNLADVYECRRLAA